MALAINKADVIRKPAGEGDFMTGINKFMGSLIQASNSMSRLIEGYDKLKGKITGQTAQTPQQQTAVQPAYRHPPQQQPKQLSEESDRLKKATGIFDELHAKAKPYFPMVAKMEVAQLIQMAMQPKNKQKIIEEIARRL